MTTQHGRNLQEEYLVVILLTELRFVAFFNHNICKCMTNEATIQDWPIYVEFNEL